MPATLPKSAAPIWRATLATLADSRRLTPAVLPAVERYCQTWCRWREAEGHLLGEGVVIAAPKTGVQAVNVWLGVSRQSAAQLGRMEADLGLSPRRSPPTRPLALDGTPLAPAPWFDAPAPSGLPARTAS